MYQQGDVLIEEWEGKIEGNKLDHLILQEGEATGHAHRVSSGLAELFESGSTKFLKVKKETTISHEEHKPIILPPGNYRVRRVREYDHFLEESRNVQD